MLEYQNKKIFFAKGYTLNWSEDIFVIKEVKNTAPWTYIINGHNGEEIIRTFSGKNCKKQISKDLEQKISLKEREIISIFILKTICFILQNMFQSLYTSSPAVHIKSTVNTQIIRVCDSVTAFLRYNLKTFI